MVFDGNRSMLIVALAFAIIMVDGFDLQAIGFVAPEIARSWSLSMAAFGPVFAAGLAGSMVGAMSAGPIARKIGRRAVLILALLTFGGGTLATTLAGDLQALLALRLIVGIGVGAAVPAAMSIVAEHSPARLRATMVVLTLCGQPIGAILGAALCARYMPTHGWTFAFYLGGVLPLLLVPAVLLLLPARDAAAAVAENGSQEGGLSGRLRELFGPSLIATTALLWVCSFLTALYLYLIVNWLPGAARNAGYSLQSSVLAISLFNFGGIAGALLTGFLMDRLGPLRVLPVAVGLGALAMATLDVSLAASGTLLIASCVSGFFAYGGGACLGSLAVMLYSPSMRTTGAGWMLGIGRLGAALGPLGAGAALAAGLGMGRLFYFASAAALLVSASLVGLAQVRSRRTGTESGSSRRPDASYV